MSREHDFAAKVELPGRFSDAAEKRDAKAKPKPPSPFSLRLTWDERAWLEAEAGTKPLGSYIRERLFGDLARKRRVSRRPSTDHKKLAMVLAELGRSRLASNMNQLAKAANAGVLDGSPEIETDIREACTAIAAMREMLVEALGVKPEGGP